MKTKKILLDVYFTVEYSHLVEVEVEDNTPQDEIEAIAKDKCFLDVVEHVETAFEKVSGCYLSESLTMTDVVKA